MSHSIDLHVHPKETRARIKYPTTPTLTDVIAYGDDINMFCRSDEQARRLVLALNDAPERDLNTSLIDAMFLIWSLRLMTNLSWDDTYAFVKQAIGIGEAVTQQLFFEADKRIGGLDGDGDANLKRAFELKHDYNLESGLVDKGDDIPF